MREGEGAERLGSGKDRDESDPSDVASITDKQIAWRS